MKKTIITLAAIASITILEVYALKQGIDGSLLSVVVAVIAGLGGYVAKGQITQNESAGREGSSTGTA